MGLLASFRSCFPRVQSLHRLCKRYVDFYNNDNCCDFTKNGEERFLCERLPGANIVFDIGANVGEWSHMALKINPEIRLHCFEPSLAAFKVLSGRNFAPKAVLNNFGMGSVKEDRILYVIGEASGVNSCFRREGLEHLGTPHGPIEEQIIHVETVDEYCEDRQIRKVDFVKIDVEGFELQVFKGMRRMIADGSIHVIQFEYGGTFIDAGVFLKDIWNYVVRLNCSYGFYKICPDGLRYFPKYSQLLENFQYQNWAIVRDDD